MKSSLLILCFAIVLRDSWQSPGDNEDMSFWLKSGQDNLQRVLSIRNLEKKAKNIIIFIGDGMGISTITAGRIFKGQSKGFNGEEYKLNFEKFPNAALVKTYNIDRQVPDSAGTATAIFSGVKSRYKILGLDAKAQVNTCDKNINEAAKLSTIADWAQESGMDTGFVTTTRVTHATPGALYSHINNRDWECETEIPREYRTCVKDIARQLVEDAPGKNFKVIMGGGGQCLGIPNIKEDTDLCKRDDGRNLAEIWKNNNPDSKVVTNLKDLMAVDIANTSKIMGIFGSSHVEYSAVKSKETPSLANMTLQAIRILKKNKNGFFLLVEGGKIDIAHHANYAKMALIELSDFEDAIQVAFRELKMKETLLIVTADHSHAFTLNGYPKRGSDILGFANQTEKVDPYETLSYANGPGFFYHRRNDSTNVNETWRRVEDDQTRKSPYYRHFAGKYLKDETHGGEDVALYAIGPYSHLFRGTFEQNYIAHAVAYAACFKDWPSHCDEAYNRYYYETTKSTGFQMTSNVILLVFSILVVSIETLLGIF
ncbi:alkaline phosphatase 4-like [Leptopilina boulardi]|uniref:alkaline phosphatase 4-like n=1 Tax=Leptopilina boulardi TaxID=63433 RepID=UPI0021F66A6C|nr:alkaline phosphatase 4-like [Leptopilina boulardi]XP_051163906.1 alkaline phosphatase 4-like [Leptopilina boulardi]XP_051163907.1 alkaline phosphatase 4-like [Leptopilina boulardi]